MVIVIAVGGSVLMPDGESVTASGLSARVRSVARTVAHIAARHQVVISVGGDPQTRLLTLRAAAHTNAEIWPAEILGGALCESVASYLLEQELSGLLPFERTVVTLLTMTEVDPDDPAFKTPTKLTGPLYLREEAERLTERNGWVFRPEGDKWRRVVATPEPQRTVALQPIKWLLERKAVVIIQGIGMPAGRDPRAECRLSSVECVINADLASELLARELEADIFVMLTEADAVYADCGNQDQRRIRFASPAALRELRVSPCSMGSKVAAACRFVTITGRNAAIGAVADLPRLITGEVGTVVSPATSGVTSDRSSPVWPGIAS